jgi:hypothetical protein
MELYVSDERVAALEAYRQGDKAVMQDVSDKLDAVATDVATIKLQLEKQKGFIAGCLAILVPIWAVILATITWAASAAYEWWKTH